MDIRSTILAVMIFRHMVLVSLEVANALFQLQQPFFLLLCVSTLFTESRNDLSPTAMLCVHWR